MSSTLTRVSLGTGQHLADELCALLRPACARLEIAGSLRRQKASLGDIELVAIPRYEAHETPSLFGALFESEPQDCLLAAVDAAVEDGRLARRLDPQGRPRWGERYRALIYRQVAVDLFICRPPAQFGLLYLIRTGPEAFSKRCVTAQYAGGWLPNYLRCTAGHLEVVDTGATLETPEEAHVFEVLGRPWVQPEERQ